MQLQVKLQKTGEIMYFEAKKTKKAPANIFRGLEVRKKVRLTFLRLKDSMVNIAFSVVTNKEIRCCWCIQNVNCNKIAMVDPVPS